MTYFLAVDGGNSKTDVVIGTGDGRVLAYVRGPGTCHQNIGLPQTLARLRALVGQARAEAGLDGATAIERADVFLAGADLPTEVDMLARAVAAEGWAGTLHLDNDTFALLRAGTDAPDAIAVVCGAGINCVGQNAGGRTARFASLGQLSGDWGGGDHLAKAALWYAIRGEDGRGATTALSAAVAAHFRDELNAAAYRDAALDRPSRSSPTATGGADGRTGDDGEHRDGGDQRRGEEGEPMAAQVVGVAMHLGRIPEVRLSELTTLLFEVAAAHDPVALEVVTRQAEEIVAMARVAARRLDLLDAAVTVVLGGGVLRSRHPLLLDPVRAGLLDSMPKAGVVIVEEPPVLGAALASLDALTAAPAAHDALREALRHTRWSALAGW